MSCAGLFLLLVVFSVSQTSPLDCSDQQSTGNVSGMADHQQVTTLQYCLVDNCTIMRVDNGEILDIIYTTDSLLVTTSRGNQTSLVIMKDEAGLSCATSTTHVVFMVLILTIILSSGFILTIHLIFKDLRNTMGKLLMVLTAALMLGCASKIAKATVVYKVALDSLLVCRILAQTRFQGNMIQEACSTNDVRVL